MKASPLAFSDSSSLFDRGKEFLHSNSILGSRPLTTGTPVSIENKNDYVKTRKYKINK